MSGLLWPVPTKYGISQGFGGDYPAEAPGYLQDSGGKPWRARRTSFAGGTLHKDLHGAIDVSCPIGTPILAPETGTVVAAGTYTSTGEHYMMLRIHKGAKQQFVLFFTHIKTGGILVPVGRKVLRGGQLAKSGNSGMSSGPHLHFEGRLGRAQDDPRLSGAWFKINVQRLRVGGDMVGWLDNLG